MEIKKQYKLTGHNIDMELFFNTREEAEAKMNEWIKDDAEEFNGEDTSNDYYITEINEEESLTVYQVIYDDHIEVKRPRSAYKPSAEKLKQFAEEGLLESEARNARYFTDLAEAEAYYNSIKLGRTTSSKIVIGTLYVFTGKSLTVAYDCDEDEDLAESFGNAARYDTMESEVSDPIEEE